MERGDTAVASPTSFSASVAPVIEDETIDEKDIALAMHETFLGSGSEDALSPRFKNLEIRSSTASTSSSPRTPLLGPRSPLFSPERSSKRTTRNSSFGGFGIADGGEGTVESDKIPTESSTGALTMDVEGVELGKPGSAAFLKKLREIEFAHHKKGTARLNNGSFGACPKSVQLKQEQWLQKWLAQPDAFYYGPLEAGLLESRKVVANHVNCATEELVLLDNVTTAASILAIDLMWSFAEGRYQKGDAILIVNFIYGALRVAFQNYAGRAGAHILVADIPFPVASQDEILASYEKTLQKAVEDGRKIRMAIFDHVVSMPSIVLPVKEMVALCRRYGVEEIFVDGAQGIGTLKVDLQDIDADFYSGNLHKWCFAPTAVAFFHCKSKHLARLHHPIISHNYGKGLATECAWVGTRDYSSMLAVPAAFEFLEKLPGGLDAVRTYNHQQVIAAGQMLAEAWGTYCGVDPELCTSMVMVGLPPDLELRTQLETYALRIRLREEFAIEVHTFTPPSSSSPRNHSTDLSPAMRKVTAHLRISHQIYNTWDEYVRLRDAVIALVKEKANTKAKP